MSNSNWVVNLVNIVKRKPIIVLRFSKSEWESLRRSRRGISEFTVARSHAAIENVRVPTVCFLVPEEYGRVSEVSLGLLKKLYPITTLDSRLTITSAQAIAPSSEIGLFDLVTNNRFKSIFRSRLNSGISVIRLSAGLSGHLIERVAACPSNRQAVRAVIASLEAPTKYSGNASLQEDAIMLALKVFGLSPNAAAIDLDIVDDKDTTLARYSIQEDAVIEHDARVVPGFQLLESDLTGRAIFRKGDEILEVITANRRPLEKLFGVDLIYLNSVKQNVVMLQYKMLEPVWREDATEWVYRPDRQLEKEIKRMGRFGRSHASGSLEYRINPQVFYLRFVRRNAMLGKSAVTMPIDHFEVLRDDPRCRGPMGGFRISYDTLGGRYLRQTGFLDLVRSGYIGAYAQTAADLNILIGATLRGGRAVVAAIQSTFNSDTDAIWDDG